MTFERMADARKAEWHNSLLVYAAGFKGRAKRLSQRSGSRVYVRAAQYEPLLVAASSARGLTLVNDWLFDGADLPVRFFGDLDNAGMQILTTLREVFPDAVAWHGSLGMQTSRLSPAVDCPFTQNSAHPHGVRKCR